ncbi:crotonase/enoyl-CoA hydratase family protein [Camelimonas abortus]|uniref:Crotonase/enoyl-CoA hydratase family protein n=1 Tax=Camelimonas abortus TaxID=1017184 RepID=A0ABV7LAV8_9HYPH
MSYESIKTEGSTIKTELSDGVLTLTLNRPDRLNAFTGQMMQEMIEVFDRADADDSVRVVIVTGEGRAFCAGADLAAGGNTFNYETRRSTDDLPLGRDGKPDLAADPAVRDGGGRLTLRIFNSLKPVIGAVNGPAVGIGATMQLPMDVRIASENARFGFVFTQRGIVPEACSSWFLPRIVGIQQAVDWCYSGRVFDAKEALAGGLVKEVVPADELLPRAREIARQWSERSAPVSVALTRQMMWRMLGASHPMEAHRVDSRAIFWRGKQRDVQEGVASFLEKRLPNFPDQVSTDMPSFFPWFDEPEYR